MQTFAQTTKAKQSANYAAYSLLLIRLCLGIRLFSLSLSLALLHLRMQACAAHSDDLVIRVSSSRGVRACVRECAMNTRDRQFWTEFLLLYRSLPAVWKVKSPEYSSRALKTAGYDQLVIKLREVEPHADRALVVKKINSFRTNFRRDLRKRAEAEEAGFESTLWYFELLGFLEGQEESEEGFVSVTILLAR